MEQDCGHYVITVEGEEQHHDIPDDWAPHAPTSECGCCPERVEINGKIVYEHVDQDPQRGHVRGLIWRGGFPETIRLR